MTEIQCHHTHTFIEKHSLAGLARALERTVLTFLVLSLKHPGGDGGDKATEITLSLLLLLRLCLPHPVAPTLSLLSLWFLSDTLNTHTRSRQCSLTLAAPPRQVNRCVPSLVK